MVPTYGPTKSTTMFWSLNHSQIRYRQVQSPCWPWDIESPTTIIRIVGARPVSDFAMDATLEAGCGMGIRAASISVTLCGRAMSETDLVCKGGIRSAKWLMRSCLVIFDGKGMAGMVAS